MLNNNGLILVTDIPTPYRVHLFNELNEELNNMNVGFKVLFMAKTVPMRYWNLDETKFKFNHKFVAGVHFRYKNDVFHFNPGILWLVLKEHPKWLLIGGAWNMPTAILLLFSKIFYRDIYTILWSEANYESMRHKKGFISRVRQVIWDRVDAFAVPGIIAEYTIKYYWRINNKHIYYLPNLINEKLYLDNIKYYRLQRSELRGNWNINDDELILLWPARLHEETKGIINFLEILVDICRNKVKILLAGEGPDRGLIEKWLIFHNINYVYLLGQQSEEKMLELYALSDVLILPSLRDSNPLSVIEGLWSGLPIFISKCCGNWVEVVQEGENGWVVDPCSEKSMQEALKDLFSKSNMELVKYGNNSLSIANKYFSTPKSIHKFILELMDDK